MTALAPDATFRLGWAQGLVFRAPARFRAIIAGRRFGKTHLAAVDDLRDGLTIDAANIWYVAPTYRMAKEIAWDTYKALAKPWTVKVNETTLSIRLQNDSLLTLHGADNPDSLVGRGLDKATLDEFPLIDDRVWHRSIRPALADRRGKGLFIGSPRGFNWAYDIYVQGQDPASPDWASWQFTTLQGGRVAPEEVEAAREGMDPRLFKQEFEASFETLLGRVYGNFERIHHLDAGVTDPGGEILVGMDFNVHPMSAVIAVKAGDECYVLDALEIPTSNTEEMATELTARYPGRRLVVCPDPSGNARKTSSPVGTTDFTILRSHGFQVAAGASAPLIVDRVNNVQANLYNAAGRRRLKIHPRAVKLIRALEGLTYKDGTSLPDKTLGLDHITDALGYLLWERFNVLRQGWTQQRAAL